jgi:hypothetical protein
LREKKGVHTYNYNELNFEFNQCINCRALLNDVSSDEDEEQADSIDMSPVTMDNTEFVCGDGEHEELYPLSAFRNDMDKLRKQKSSVFLEKSDAEEDYTSRTSSDDDQLIR